MVITFAAGQMTWANAFTYVDPAVVKAAALKRIPAPAKKPSKAKPKAKK
jgi:predicted Co/Zn/Cd cation transporter (cation efflux family)